MHEPPPSHPRLFALLSTQFFDGFGARFHGVLLAIYALRISGLSGFAGFTAVGMLGIVLSTGMAGGLTSRLGGRRTMIACAITVATVRVACYAFVAFGGGLLPLMILRLIGASAGTLMINASRAQVPEGERAVSSLAWMHVANALGQAAATAVAGWVAMGPTWLIVTLGAPLAAAPTLPMLRMARFATTVALPLKEQWRSFRAIAPAAGLGALIQLCTTGLATLKDGLTVDLYSEHWLGPVAGMGLVGSFLGATLLRRFVRFTSRPSGDIVVWPVMATLSYVGWALADQGIAWMLFAQLLNGLAGQVLAACIEARLLEQGGRAGAVPALTAAGGVAAAAGAIGAIAVPPMLSTLGYVGTVAVSLVPLAALGVWGAARLLKRSSALAVVAVAGEPAVAAEPALPSDREAA